MPTFALYLLKVIICSAILFGYYHLFLRNKVYHAYNRFYLLGTVAISLLAPVINFNLLFSSQEIASKPIRLLQVVNNGDQYLEEIVLFSQRNHISMGQLIILLYVLVAAVLLMVFLRMLWQITGILKRNSSRKIQDVVFIESNEPGTPFSFFKFIFWNNQIDINTATGQQIFAHELAHVREKHSADKLFMSLALILCWINPIFWLIKQELHLIHEFIADKKAVANNDARQLAAMIVTAAYPKHSYLLSNHFFYSPIKRRLQMLTNYNSKKAGYFYRILALPVILFLVAAFTIKMKMNNGVLNPMHKITVVIDAGHGGKDAGATALDGTTEKDLNLAFIKKIKDLNTADNIKLVFTRETDIYQSPQEKAAMAKDAGADLFISLHVATGPQQSQDKTSGMEIYVSKDEFENSYASKLFASSVIQHFKNNYELNVTENPLQRKMGIWVIQSNNIPSILIEPGYMNNPKDLAYLKSEKGQDIIAKNILNAIAQYADNRNKDYKTTLLHKAADTLPPAKKTDPGYYKGEKIESISVVNKGRDVLLYLANGKKVQMTMKEADQQGIAVPPPPPPAPPPPPHPPVPPVPAVPAPPAKPIQISINDGDYNPTQEKSAQPLVVVNGETISYSSMNLIDPDNIESVNVLKGASAEKKYGKEKAANGVIEIITKTTNPDYSKNQELNPDNVVFTKLEQEPHFEGGNIEWQQYLRKYLNANMPVDEGWAAGTYKIMIKFKVAKDGTVSDVIAENYAGSKTAQMCVDLIKNGPKWIPGKQNNKAVIAYKKQPITFVVSNS